MSRHLRLAAAAALTALAACSTLDPAAADRLEVFDTHFEALRGEYPYFGRKSIDWEELGKQYRSGVVTAERPHEFYHLLAGLLSELNDAHVHLDVPTGNFVDDGTAAVSLGMLDGFELIDIGGELHVSAWPAGTAPIAPDHLPRDHQRLPALERVEGFRVVPSLVHLLFLGPPGSDTELSLRWHDGTRSRHVLRRPIGPTSDRYRLAGLLPPMPAERTAPFGYLRIATFTVPDDVTPTQAIDAQNAALDRAAGGRDGLILDLRGNRGGSLNLALRVAARFVTEEFELVEDVPDRTWFFGLFRERRFHTYVFPPLPPRITVPLAVLVDSRTGSAAEHLARILQRNGAVVVGERTAGVEASIRAVEACDGSVLEFGADSILDGQGRGFQDVGVTPDVVVELRWEDVAAEGPRLALQRWDRRLVDAARRALLKASPKPLVRSAPTGTGERRG